MNSKLIYHAAIIACFCLFAGCQNLEGDFEFDTDQVAAITIMDADIHRGDTVITVFLSHTTPLDYVAPPRYDLVSVGTRTFNPETGIANAQIKLFQEGTLVSSFTENDSIPGIYVLEHKVSVGNYRLEAQVPGQGDLVYSNFNVPVAVSIDYVNPKLITVNDKKYVILDLYFNDPPNQSNYYSLRYGFSREANQSFYFYEQVGDQEQYVTNLSDIGNQEENDTWDVGKVFNDKTFTGQHDRIRILVDDYTLHTVQLGGYTYEVGIGPSDSVYVRLNSVSAPTFFNDASIANYNEAINDRRTPDNPYTNVTNGLGCIKTQNAFIFSYKNADKPLSETAP